MDDFTGRTAFITGGAQGIGLAIARRLAREGVKIALADLDREALAQAEKELSPTASVATVALDVRDREAFARAAAEVESRLGPVSILVNNAGIAGGAPVAEMTHEVSDWVLGINLHGVLNGIQTFVPGMIGSGQGGYVLNTASGAGLANMSAGYLYTTSKFAVVGLSEALHQELGAYGIGVSVLCPGMVATRIAGNTGRLRPADSAETSEVLAQALAEADRHLMAEGVPTEQVGEMVFDAMRAGRLFIHTDDIAAEPVRLRTEAILAALPSALAAASRQPGS
jgi:NAD(P)-dependent dehydrogenase (short-subunit alcohol dehydrogenase family)